MRIRHVIQEQVRARLGGSRISSDLNAAIAANVGEREQVTGASSTLSDRAETDPAGSALHPKRTQGGGR